MTDLEKRLRKATFEARKLKREMGGIGGPPPSARVQGAAVRGTRISADAMVAKAFRVKPV